VSIYLDFWSLSRFVDASPSPARFIRPGAADEQVEPLDEGAVAGCFFAAAAPLGVGGERFGVGALGGEDRQEALLGAEVGAVLADVGVRAGALGGGAQAVAAGEAGP
jgi:hypothetical protein